MKTKIIVTVVAFTSDPEVEKRIYNAAAENDLLDIITLLEHCDTSEATFDVREVNQPKLLTKFAN
jgi:hypothetical protein